jgi:hypothetical protein
VARADWQKFMWGQHVAGPGNSLSEGNFRISVEITWENGTAFF